MDDIPPPENRQPLFLGGRRFFFFDSPFLSNLWGVLGPSWPLELLRPPEEQSFEKDSTGCSEGSYADGKRPCVGSVFLEVIFLNINPPKNMTYVICFKSVFLVSHCVFFFILHYKNSSFDSTMQRVVFFSCRGSIIRNSFGAGLALYLTSCSRGWRSDFPWPGLCSSTSLLFGKKTAFLGVQTQHGKVVLDEYEQDAVAKSNSNWWLLLEGNIIWLMMVARRISWMPSKLPLWWCGVLQTVKLDAEDQTKSHRLSLSMWPQPRYIISDNILMCFFVRGYQVCKSATP